jgi:hypothetical protein
MPHNLTIFFYRSDRQRERISLGECTITAALEAAQRVFHIGDGLYTKAELYEGDELIETLPNPASVHAGTILVQ